MHIPILLNALLLLLTSTHACLLADFYYEQDNHQRLYGLLKDNGTPLCGITKQGAMRTYKRKTGSFMEETVGAYDIVDKCEELTCKVPGWAGRICRDDGDVWRVELQQEGREVGFGLKVDDKGHDERRLTEAVWGCTQEEIDGHKGKGFPNGEVHV